MGTANTHKTDLYSLFNYVQNTQITHPKEIFIETLRNYFSEDSYYHYSRDQWGFPNTPDHTNLLLGAGLDDEITTRLYIGEYYRYDVSYYPSLLVKHTGSSSMPISMSRNKGSVQWEAIQYVDGYGNKTSYSTPSYFIEAGAWEGSLSVDIETKSLRSRDELAQIVSQFFVSAAYEDLYKSGVVIKSGSPKVGSPTEEDDRNDKIFKVSVNFDIYSEWRRHTPITSVVDAINICVELGDLREEPARLAPNVTVVTSIDLINEFAEL
jgi:hypothetical protein